MIPDLSRSMLPAAESSAMQLKRRMNYKLFSRLSLVCSFDPEGAQRVQNVNDFVNRKHFLADIYFIL